MRNKLESTIFRLFAPIFFAVFLWFLAIPELLAQSANPYALLRKPAVSKTQIAFSYGGDLWVVDRGGGEAKRLTSDVGIEIDPVFSPDGTMIAFTGENRIQGRTRWWAGRATASTSRSARREAVIPASRSCTR